MALLERLYVEITADTQKLETQLNKAAASAQKMGREMRAVGRDLSFAVTVPLAAVGAAAVKMASDAEESANKFNVVMGGAADEVRARLEELTATIPLTRSELEQFAGGIQDMLVPMGLAREQAANLSADVVELAGDLASFNNVGTDRVLEAIQSALAGSSEPMRRFGVDTREARLQTLALEQGLIGQGEQLDNAARALAVLAAIQADSTDAMGDAARTVDSTANTFRFLARDVRELSIQLGRELIPIIKPVVDQVGDLVQGFTELDEGTKRAIVTFGLIAGAAGPVLVVMGSVIGALGNIATLLASGGAIAAALSGPGGWLIAGLGLAAAAWLKFRDNSDEARQSLHDLRTEMDGATEAVRAHALAVVTIEYFDNLDQITAIKEEWDRVGRITENERLRLNALERRQDELIRQTVAIAEAWIPVVDATKEVAENVTAAASAVSGITIPSAGDRDVSGGFALGFDLGPISIPETIAALSSNLGDVDDAAQRAGVSIGDMGQATRLLTGEAGRFVQAFATGGVVGGIVAAIGGIISSAEEAARRIEEARRAVAAAIDAYVDELAGLDQFERAERQAIEGAREVLQAFADQITAGIKSDKIREAFERQFDEAINSLDLDQIRDLLAQFGDDGARVLAELERRLAEVNRQREEEARRIKEEAEALERANAARRAAEIEAGKGTLQGIIDQIVRRDLELNGSDRDLRQFDLDTWARDTIERLRELRDTGVLSNDAFARLVATINGQVIESMEQFDQAARDAAAAAEEAARAERFRQRIDLENLRVRLLVAQGLDDEAFALKQQLELLQAIEEGRSEEYIALLKQVQAQEAANRAAQEAADTQREVQRAAEDSTRALDGMIRVLNGPAGFTTALYRNRALRGTPDFGVSSASPVFGAGGGGGSSVTINVQTTPGQSNEEIAEAVYEQVVRAHNRNRLRGGVNPFGGL